jgi:hypothetical protein
LIERFPADPFYPADKPDLSIDGPEMIDEDGAFYLNCTLDLYLKCPCANVPGNGTNQD